MLWCLTSINQWSLGTWCVSNLIQIVPVEIDSVLYVVLSNSANNVVIIIRSLDPTPKLHASKLIVTLKNNQRWLNCKSLFRRESCSRWSQVVQGKSKALPIHFFLLSVKVVATHAALLFDQVKKNAVTSCIKIKLELKVESVYHLKNSMPYLKSWTLKTFSIFKRKLVLFD